MELVAEDNLLHNFKNIQCTINTFPYTAVSLYVYVYIYDQQSFSFEELVQWNPDITNPLIMEPQL